MAIKFVPKLGGLSPEEPAKGVNFKNLSEKLKFQESLRPHLDDRLLDVFRFNGSCDLFQSNYYLGRNHEFNKIHHVVRENDCDYVGDEVYDKIGEILAKI